MDYYKGRITKLENDKKELEETIKALKQQHSEAITSLYNRFVKISNIGHSDDMHKNIRILEIADKTTAELDKDIKIELAKTAIKTNSK